MSSNNMVLAIAVVVVVAVVVDVVVVVGLTGAASPDSRNIGFSAT